MTIDETKSCLLAGGFQISKEARLPDDRGTKLNLSNGAFVNIFDTGKISVQGKNQDPVNECLGLKSASLAITRPVANSDAKPMLSKVFVVYGHDATARTDLEAMLRRWRLEPLILDQLPNEGHTIIEKLEKAIAEAKFAIVLATPDDEGHRANHPDEKAFRARQNVVLELGMLLARLGRKNVAILMKQQDTMENPSDIHGLMYIPFKDSLQNDAGKLLAKEMNARGYPISIANL